MLLQNLRCLTWADLQERSKVNVATDGLKLKDRGDENTLKAACCWCVCPSNTSCHMTVPSSQATSSWCQFYRIKQYFGVLFWMDGWLWQ